MIQMSIEAAANAGSFLSVFLITLRAETNPRKVFSGQDPDREVVPSDSRLL